MLLLKLLLLFSIKITALTFLARKSKLELSGMSFLRKREKKLNSNLVIEVDLVFKS